jgi:hypothetical protein
MPGAVMPSSLLISIKGLLSLILGAKVRFFEICESGRTSELWQRCSCHGAQEWIEKSY